MKKWIAGLLFVFIISVCSVYIFIPSKQLISFDVSVNYLQAGVEKIFLDKDKLQNWWPGKREHDNVYSYKNYQYRVQRIMISGINFIISNGKDSVAGMMQVIPATGNKTLLRWESPVDFSSNPVTRLQQYFSYVDYKKNIKELLTTARPYFEKEENIYGFKVNKQIVTDTTMVSLKQSFNHYPSTQEVYTLINSINSFIATNSGEGNSYPMVNVHTEDSSTYDLMVAVPTKKDVKTKPPFMLKKMIPGNILVAEVRGGIYTIREAEKQLFNYASDFQMSSPAIPFQSLVTNRLQQTDTSKWITKLYFPVF